MKMHILNSSLLNTGALAALQSRNAMLQQATVFTVLVISLTIHGLDRLITMLNPFGTK